MEEKEKFYLREVEVRDKDLLLDWANEKTVRLNSFNTAHISSETHNKWFNEMMKDPLQIQYIMMLEDRPVGQIRFSLSDDLSEAEVDYSIDFQKRGLGLGKNLIKLGIEKIREQIPSVKKIIGKVKEDNIASEKCFTACGFITKFKQLEINCGDSKCHDTL